MSEIMILSNVPKGKIPGNFVEVATQLMVDQLQKPKEIGSFITFCGVAALSGCNLCMGDLMLRR